ncbi:MAG: hypothetical protein KDH09_01485 [Chrysiogenetes bacterium]|nr:hypothetical protein [Chrysiogenetes bacterium]
MRVLASDVVEVSEPQAREAPAEQGVAEPDPAVPDLESTPAKTEPTESAPGGAADAPTKPAADKIPHYITGFVTARDLMLNREYEAAYKSLQHYGINHRDDAIEAVGEALLEVLSMAEQRDFRRTQRLDAVFARARIAAHSWIPKAPDPVFASMLAGVSDAINATWLLKTGSKLSGLNMALGAINRIEDAAKAADPSLDARGFYAMYLYMRGRYGSRYIPFVKDTRNVGRIGVEKCVKEAPTMGPLCHLFLLYVAKWERRWDDLDKLGDKFREKYPASMFAALIQAEGLLAAQKPEKALSVLVDVARFDPNFPLHHLWMGRVYWEGLVQPLPAEEFVNLALKEGLNQKTRISEAHTVLAEIAMTQGYFAEAKIRIDWALEFDSDNKRAEIDEEKLDDLMKKAQP